LAQIGSGISVPSIIVTEKVPGPVIAVAEFASAQVSELICAKENVVNVKVSKIKGKILFIIIEDYSI
jgi:hypothetical protein